MKVKFMFFIAALCYVSVANSQKVGTTYTPITSQSAYFDVSLPLTEIGAILPKGAAGHHLYKQNREIPQLFEDKIYNNRDAALPQGNDPIWQQTVGPKGMSNPLVNFEGTRNDDNVGMVAPPDTDGDVGPNNYFQMCNTIFQIFDKQGNSLFGPADNSTIWSGFIGSWTGTNDGDPIVLYDQQADRWLVSQFAVNCSDGTYWELVAVSTTSNPTGSYYRYAFQFTSFPDYPKFGIWRDGYYLMVQHGNGTVTAAALNRTQMLAGTSPAQMVSFSMPNLNGSGFIGMLPSDNDGQWAPAGTPNYFVYFNDDAWNADPDELNIWSFSVNWSFTWLSTLTHTTSLPTAAFSSEFGTHNQGIIPQPGTTNKLAVMEKALMNRMQYRNFGTYQSMLCCHTVDVNGSNRAGMRWYELRRTTGAWSIYQQGTYAPGTTDNYWMGSIAQNGDGDIALGFSVSSATRYPSIHYTGRNPNDPLGQMTLGEKAIISGANSQNGTARWGDYTMMSVDPSDDETFWYTNEYLGNYTSWGAWITQIASFKLGDNCAASGGCSEYISRVQAGTINNLTACSGYGDYTATHSTNLPVNGVVHATVTNGSTSFSGDQCGIWVDWNRNGSFYDAGEQMSVTGTPGVGPYTATIIPPAGQTVGSCIMRVRITWVGTLDPCGTTGFGEVEDYTLNITAKASNVWTGNYNHYWENAGNWSLEHIPTPDENVIIPNVNMPLWVDYYNAECNNLTTYAGTTLLVKGWALTVNGDMSISGQFAMDNSAGRLYAMGDVYWESGSTANITAASIMWIYGFWEFKSGANVQLANGYVDFAGNTDTYIRTYAPNCSFYNVGVYKTAGHFLGLSYLSSYDLTINGYLGIQPNAAFSGASTHSLILRGAFYNNYHFSFDYGTLVMDGANQSITPGVGDYLNNLTISPTGTTTVNNTYSTTLTVKGSVSIQSGVFDPLNNTVEVRGNWTNAVGPAAFTEGTGKVRFNSPSHNYVLSNETFYTIEANMGAALRVNNVANTVTCSYYDWTAGAIDVLAGTFTANNLVDNGLYGDFYVNPGGTINLNNPDGWVDLNGNIYVIGGTMNVYGGNGSDSFWPYNTNGSVTVSSGTLDFKNVGVFVTNTSPSTFSENITGGTIRTSRGFTVLRGDYTPTGGVVEFYGSTDGTFYTDNGGYVRNVIINKGVADNSSGSGSNVVRNRLTGEVTDAPLANTITLGGDADINGSVIIQNGILSAGAHSISVEGDWDNQVGTGGFVEGTSTVNFDGLPYTNIVNGETFYNFWESKTNTDFDAVELMYGMTMNVMNNLWMWDGSLELNGATTLNGGIDIEIGSGAGINANDGVISINVQGNWSNGNADYNVYHGFDPGYYSTVTFNGATDQTFWTNCPQEDFANLSINKSAGKFRPQDNTQSYGNVLIQNGSWEDILSGLTHSVFGNFTVASTGSFLTTSIANTVEFKGSQNSVLSYSGALGYFRNLLVNKTPGYGVTQATDIYTQFGGNLTVGTGTYNLGGNFLMSAGDVTVNSTGILSLPAASIMAITDTKTLNVNSGGRIEIAGTSGNKVNIRANTAGGRYNFNVNSGGAIAADYCIFKNMGVSGINVKTGSSIDLAHSFTGCTFQDGANNGTLLTIDNNESRTIRNAVFPTNIWGGAFNVTKTVNGGVVYFVDYSGAWSGEANDNDFYNRVQWVPTLISAPTATPASICPGSPSQLHAVASGGVGPYTYAWTPAGSLSNATLENPVATPLATTPYAVLVTDALGTTVTGNVTVTVLPMLTPSVTIAASANPSVPGDYVNFTATPVNGGSSPTYVWKVNGSAVGTGPSYFYKPNNHDQVTCEMTSNYACVTGNPAISNVITMVVIPVNRTETGTINAPLSLCFDASNTITVAGGGNVFVVKTGASAVFIAGVKISFLPGTTVENGGYMHGYIATTNNYCGFAPAPVPSVIAGEGEVQTEPLAASQMFSIYPNPTSGKFTLQHKGNVALSQVQVEIYDLRGNKVFSTSYTGETSHQVIVPAFLPGLYFVKVTAGDQLESFKLVVTR